MHPGTGESLTDEQRKAVAQRTAVMTQWLKQGVSADNVGEMVLTAVLANSLYIHTDRVMAEPIQARTKALLDAMPAA